MQCCWSRGRQSQGQPTAAKIYVCVSQPACDTRMLVQVSLTIQHIRNVTASQDLAALPPAFNFSTDVQFFLNKFANESQFTGCPQASSPQRCACPGPGCLSQKCCWFRVHQVVSVRCAAGCVRQHASATWTASLV